MADEREKEPLDKKFKKAAANITSPSSPKQRLLTKKHNAPVDPDTGKLPPEAPKEIKQEAPKEDAPKKESGMADTFASAFKQALPLLIGTALGGLETGVGAQEGFIASQERDRKNKLAQEEIEIKRMALQQKTGKRNLTFSDEIADESGRPVFADRDSGQLIDLDGNVVTRPRNLMQERFSQGEERRGKQLTLQFNKYGLDKQKTSQLSDTQVNKLDGLSKVGDSLDRIQELKKNVNTGPVASRAQSAGELVGATSEQFTRLKSDTENTVADYIKSISGAQASEPEVNRLKRVAPNINDDDKTFNAKLSQFRKIVKAAEQSLANSIATGQPLKKGTIDAIIDKFSGKETPEQAALLNAEQQSREPAKAKGIAPVGSTVSIKGKRYRVTDEGYLPLEE